MCVKYDKSSHITNYHTQDINIVGTTFEVFFYGINLNQVVCDIQDFNIVGIPFEIFFMGLIIILGN